MNSSAQDFVPEISVVIPTFNRSRKLPTCVGSIRAQDFENWEVVIVDDGSTDTTPDVVGNLQALPDGQKIKYVRKDNGGPSSARNFGVGHAQGRFIVYLDSDDTFYPSALTDIVWTLKDEEALYGLVNHNRTLCLIDESGSLISRKFDTSGLNRQVGLEDIYNWDIKTTSSGLFHKKFLFDQGVKWRSGFWIEDLEFMLQLAAMAPKGFRHIPKVLVDYLQTYGGDGLCSNASYADWAHAFKSIYELHKDDPLMKKPEVYLDRIKKYLDLHQKSDGGHMPPAAYKYFPEFFASVCTN